MYKDVIIKGASQVPVTHVPAGVTSMSREEYIAHGKAAKIHEVDGPEQDALLGKAWDQCTAVVNQAKAAAEAQAKAAETGTVDPPPTVATGKSATGTKDK